MIQQKAKRRQDKGKEQAATRVEIRLTKGIRGISTVWVKRIVVDTLSAEKVRRYEAGVLVTGDREIRRINKKFLDHDYATDVISFGLEAGRGDIVVSAGMARRLARELGIPFKEELARYLVHGTLHLLGYDDIDKRKRAKMRREEKRLMTLARKHKCILEPCC